jgi:hypothetical protein
MMAGVLAADMIAPFLDNTKFEGLTYRQLAERLARNAVHDTQSFQPNLKPRVGFGSPDQHQSLQTYFKRGFFRTAQGGPKFRLSLEGQTLALTKAQMAQLSEATHAAWVQESMQASRLAGEATVASSRPLWLRKTIAFFNFILRGKMPPVSLDVKALQATMRSVALSHLESACKQLLSFKGGLVMAGFALLAGLGLSQKSPAQSDVT